MKRIGAVIKLNVPEYQIGEPVTVYFKDTMQKFGICDKEHIIVHCTECKHFDNYNVECTKNHDPKPPYNIWYCADGEKL